MITGKQKADLNEFGRKLGLLLPGFYGKVAFNYQNGVYVNSNVEQSIKPDNLNKGVEHE